MMTDPDFEARIKTLERRGFPREKASQYAYLIGDIIETDKDGLWVVRDEDRKIIDRIPPITN